MIKIGITGHQKLDKEENWVWVEDNLRRLLRKETETIVGVTSLAIGADQLFAQIILELNGLLHVVIPFPNYENQFVSEKMKSAYSFYLQKASWVEILEYKLTEEKGYLNAGHRVVDLSQKMIAIWNGKSAAGIGGTGDIVKYCRHVNKDLILLNPNLKKVFI